MRVTIKDVAKTAGVSPATVSLVLNDKPVAISQGTRKKVLQAAKELHYRPNQLAVGLVTRSTRTIGLILPDAQNPFFAALSQQIELRMSRQKMSVIVGNTGGDPGITRNYLRLFSDQCVDGIILAQLDFEEPAETEKCCQLIRDIDLPMVYVDRVAQDENHFSVAVDQERAGYLAARHLLELGHRRIGCAAGSIFLDVNARRYSGYCRALSEYGLMPDPELLYCDTLTVSCGCKALPNLLGQHVTAIFAFNDMIAYGIYKECRSYGISIPRDLSVVGVDDVFLSDIIDPPLTTVAQPVSEIADLAVDGMLHLIQNEKGERPRAKLDSVLKVRGSTASVIQPPHPGGGNRK